MREMKDSGIEWVGKIPIEWDTIRIKNLFDYRNEKNFKPLEEVNLISLYTDLGVVQHCDLEATTGNKASNADGYKLVFEDDIVVNIILCWMGAIGRSAYTGVTSPAYDVYVPQEGTNSRFYHYLFRTQGFSGDCYKAGRGIMAMRWRTYSDQFRGIRAIAPPLGEQDRIVDFLDQKCTEIDAAIAKTKRTIEEYKKLKQSIIANAVTKGIRGDRPMKDSGIEWIGEISKSHPLMKLKYVCQILDQYRKPVTADQRSQNGEILYDYYGASGVIDKIDDYTIDDHVMLIGEDGANLRMRNLPLMYEVNGKAWINNHAHILKPNEGTYFYYLFYALEGLDINPYITGSAQPKLSQDSLKNIWIPMPTYEEQKEIANYIIAKCAEMDALIARKTALLEEMESYKKSVIYEYVTGKKEV